LWPQCVFDIAADITLFGEIRDVGDDVPAAHEALQIHRGRQRQRRSGARIRIGGCAGAGAEQRARRDAQTGKDGAMIHQKLCGQDFGEDAIIRLPAQACVAA
jgi:hypothetical protein